MPTPPRRRFLAAATSLALAVLAAPVQGHSPPPAGPLVQVEVHDRTAGHVLPLYGKDGRSYVVGAPGNEYAIRIRNLTGRRVLAVTSVDGVNVVTGETAAPDQSGYVLEPWGSVEIAGWRKSLDRTAAFYFSEHAQSYAARTGRPFDVGVIGVAAFHERRPAVARVAEAAGESSRAQAADQAMPSSPSAEAAGASAERRDRAEAPAAAAPMAKLGTGHGRSETSYARRVTFERATSEPAQVVAVQYDRYENLLAIGVLPPPRLARSPRPFPGARFVPDPD